MTATLEKGITWEEYLKLPLTHYEIIDGEVKEVPASSIEHQVVSNNINSSIRDHIRKLGLGIILYAPADIVISKEPLRTRQPDLFFISKERGGTAANVRRLQRIEFAPDLVIEILSPNETAQDWLGKLRDYAKIGVREMWLIDSDSRTIEAIVIENGQWRTGGVFSGTEAMQSLVLPGIELLPNLIFEDQE